MSIALPEVTASLRSDGVTVGLAPEKLLFVGQQGTGSAATGVLTENIGVSGEEDALYGADSPLATAIRRGRRRNKATIFDAIGIDDNGSGVDAEYTITFTGDSTADGTVALMIGSERFQSVTVNTTALDTDDDIAAAVETAINGLSNVLVVAAAVTNVVTLTAVNAGTFGNNIPISVITDVTGTTSAVAQSVPGSLDPVIAGILDVIGENRYQGIVWQFDQDTDEVKDFLDARFNVQNNLLDGVAFVGQVDTFSNHLSTLGADNSQSLSINVDKLIATGNVIGSTIMDVPFTKVAEFAAIRALRRTDDAILGSNVIARSVGDSFGGISLNSKPYFNTPLPDLEQPVTNTGFTDLEVRQLRAAGGWIIDSNRAGNTIITGEVVTTYKTDVAANPDPTFGFLNYVDTSTACREYIVNNTRAKYVQYRAASGALTKTGDSANEASVAAFVTELNGDLADFGLVNSGLGTLDGEDVDFDKAFKEALTVSLDPVAGKFTISLKLFIVTQARVFLYDMAVAFEI